MKKLILFALIAFIGFGFKSAYKSEGKKHALIIAIGNYPEETDWAPISSLNDVKLIQDALTKQGFNEFTILRDAEADKESIIKAIDALTKRVEAGDIAVIHFSSHGQQIMDQNHDELDGYDEAIVAYGAPAEYDALYKGENHVRDEELGGLMDKLRLKIGPTGDVLLFVDACHSGTPTRGPKKEEPAARKRGGRAAFAPPNYAPDLKPGSEYGMLEEVPFSNVNKADLAPMVVLSAAQADEVNYEYSNYGSLSVAISRSLDNLSPDFTYRALFARIMKEMSILAPKQNPAIEGDVDRMLFAGQSVVQDKYYTVHKIRNTHLNMNGGMLTGVFDECKVGIYPAGTVNYEKATAVSTGTVTVAEGTWANVKLDKPLTGDPKDYWVFITDRTFGDQRVSVSFDKDVTENEIKAFKLSLGEFNLLDFESEEPEFKLSLENNRWNMLRLSDATVFAENLSIAQLKEDVQAYAQGRLIKNLDLEEPGINVTFELVPAIISRGAVKEVLDVKDYTTNGVVSYSTRDVTLIKVTNHGDEAVYFNIVDIQPDGYINAIAPSDGESAGQFKIAPHSTKIVPGKKVEFGPPYGTEVFKLFASTEALDLSPIITSRGAKTSTRGKLNPIETLFQNSYQLGTRGGKAGTLSVDAELTTSTFTFKIVKP